MQFSHHDVFEAAAHQLQASAKDLGADEAGNVVEMDPGLGAVPRADLGRGDSLS